MDAHEVFVTWKLTQKMPSIHKIKAAMMVGDVRGMELIATMYLQKGERINADQILDDGKFSQMLLEGVPKTWTPRVVKAIQIQRPSLPQLELYFNSMQQFTQPVSNLKVVGNETKNQEEPVTPRRGVRHSSRPNTIQTRAHSPLHSPPTADGCMAEKQNSSIWVLARVVEATVDVEWVRQCASSLELTIPFQEQVDRHSFPLLQDGNKRHVHHVDNSIANFMNVLYRTINTADSKTITWEFSSSIRNQKAIHMQKLAEALLVRCPKNPLEFMVFACSLGVPTTKLLKTRDCLRLWGVKRNISQDVLVKLLLRKRFQTTNSSNETASLLAMYTKHIHEFVDVKEDEYDVETFFFERYYSYPTINELRYLWQRVQQNAKLFK